MIHLALSAILFCSGVSSPEPEVAPAPVKEPAPKPEAAAADQLLTRLETSDARIRTIQGELVYDKTMVIAGDRRTRTGKLFYKVGEKDSGKAFAIHFDTLVLGDRVENREEQYIFNGEWLTEKLIAEKQIIKRQVVKPGEKFDPLKIGEGPLPIPIGQKKADVLARYDVTLVDVTDGLDDDTLKEFVAGTSQLKLIPKEGADRNFKEIRLWYREEPTLEGKPLLPRMARTVNSGDDITVVRLIDMKINQPIDAAQFESAAPDKTWTVREEPFRQ